MNENFSSSAPEPKPEKQGDRKTKDGQKDLLAGVDAAERPTSGASGKGRTLSKEFLQQKLKDFYTTLDEARRDAKEKAVGSARITEEVIYSIDLQFNAFVEEYRVENRQIPEFDSKKAEEFSRRIDGFIERLTPIPKSDGENDRKDAFEKYQTTRAETQENIRGKIAYYDLAIEKAKEQIKTRTFGEVLDSTFKLGGLLGTTVQEGEDNELKQLQKARMQYVREQENFMRRFPQRGSEVMKKDALDAAFKELEEFRTRNLSLPAQPSTIVDRYDDRVAMANRARQEGKKIDIDYQALNEELRGSAVVLDAWENFFNAVDTGAQIATNAVPYGNLVYNFSKSATSIAIGSKSVEESAKEFAIDFVSSKLAGGALKGIKGGGKLALKEIKPLAEKFAKSVAKIKPKTFEKVTKLFGQTAAEAVAKKTVENGLKKFATASFRSVFQSSAEGAVSGALQASLNQAGNEAYDVLFNEKPTDAAVDDFLRFVQSDQLLASALTAGATQGFLKTFQGRMNQWRQKLIEGSSQRTKDIITLEEKFSKKIEEFNAKLGEKVNSVFGRQEKTVKGLQNEGQGSRGKPEKERTALSRIPKEKQQEANQGVDKNEGNLPSFQDKTLLVGDIHIGQKGSDGIDAKNRFDAVARSLRDMKKINQAPKAIVDTGDFLDKVGERGGGTFREIAHSIARSRLELARDAGIDPKNYFVVTGNHDLPATPVFEGGRPKLKKSIRAFDAESAKRTTAGLPDAEAIAEKLVTGQTPTEKELAPLLSKRPDLIRTFVETEISDADIKIWKEAHDSAGLTLLTDSPDQEWTGKLPGEEFDTVLKHYPVNDGPNLRELVNKRDVKKLKERERSGDVGRQIGADIHTLGVVEGENWNSGRRFQTIQAPAVGGGIDEGGRNGFLLLGADQQVEFLQFDPGTATISESRVIPTKKGVSRPENAIATEKKPTRDSMPKTKTDIAA